MAPTRRGARPAATAATRRGAAAGPPTRRRTRARLALRVFATALAAAFLATLALPARAPAARDVEVSIMDDQLLLGAPKAEVDAAMRRFVALGIDRLRVSAFWAHHAPAAGEARKPRFDATNPYDPAYNWSGLDPVVVSAAEHGLKVMISISTPAPIWATGSPRRRNPVWRPDAQELASFAYAVAARYGGAVDQYGLLNEPNQGAWLQPQSDGRGFVAPHLYRELARAMYEAVKIADPESVALVGELAPSGRDDRGATRPIRPLAFLRAMACVNSRYRPVRGGRCSGFRPVVADAVGHHPYALFSAPTRRSRERDDAAIGDGRRLLAALERLRRSGRLVASTDRPLDVHYSEFGYQTDPPDPFAGIPLSRHDRWLQDAARVAWATPRVRSINQFRLTDGAIRGRGPERFNEFQSGLLFENGRAKPAYRSFAHPIVLTRAGRRQIRVWGHVRPRGAHRVSVERRTSSGRYRPVARARTDDQGFFEVRVSARRGLYRYRYADDGARGASRPVRFGSR